MPGWCGGSWDKCNPDVSKQENKCPKKDIVYAAVLPLPSYLYPILRHLFYQRFLDIFIASRSFAFSASVSWS